MKAEFDQLLWQWQYGPESWKVWYNSILNWSRETSILACYFYRLQDFSLKIHSYLSLKSYSKNDIHICNSWRDALPMDSLWGQYSRPVVYQKESLNTEIIWHQYHNRDNSLVKYFPMNFILNEPSNNFHVKCLLEKSCEVNVM